MKLNYLVGLIMLLSPGAMVACNDNDDYQPNETVLNAFSKEFPNAKRIEWEKQNGYEVAEFTSNGDNLEVWYDASGKLHLTETDLSLSQLPQAIKDHISNSPYKDYKYDDLDKVVRTGEDPVYVIEMEHKTTEQEVTLFYLESGKLIKTVLDHDSDSSNTPIPSQIKEYITSNYPNATIVDLDQDGILWVVDIWDNNMEKEVAFNDKYQWQNTITDIENYSSLPVAVQNQIQEQGYNAKQIDDIELFESSTTTYYRIEIENSNVILNINTDGTPHQ